jgi:DHA2 family multidrug resistance protein-like MFS transporter
MDHRAPNAPLPQRALLLAIMLPVWLAAIDTAIANTALPRIAADLAIQPAQAIWVINAYQLAIVATLLPLAASGQHWGERRVFLIGVAVFCVASLLCSVVSSLAALTAARALQGLGASAIMAVNLALVRRIYPPEHLGRGVGLNAFVVGMGYTSGPSLAALILSVADWPWLFAINVPLCLWAAHLGLRRLPQREHTPTQPFDLPLAALTALTLGAALWALTHTAQGSEGRWVLGLVTLSAVSAVAMLRRQRGHAQPMWPADLLRLPPFALSVLTSVSSFATQGLAFVGLPFFFEQQLRRAPVDTGLLLSIWALTVALTGPWAGRWSDRVRPAVLGSCGLLMLAAGMGLLAALGPSASFTDIAWRMAWCGLGFGLFQSPNLKAILSSSPRSRSSGASGMIALARLSGQTTGAALVALCFGWWASDGPQAALWLGCATATFGATVSAARLRFNAHMSPTPQPQQETPP